MSKSITYERVILTLIAGMLFLNLLKGSNYDGENSRGESNIKFISQEYLNSKYTVVPVNEDGSIDVRIKSSLGPMDVNIRSSDSHSLVYSGPIEVKIAK